LDCEFKMSHILYFSIIFLILKENYLICITLLEIYPKFFSILPCFALKISQTLNMEWIIGQNISDREAEICYRLVDIVLEQRWLK
jgi:hypothetical protein